MTYGVFFTTTGKQDLRALARKRLRDVLRRVDEALRRLAEDPVPANAERIEGTRKGSPPCYRLRVGDYRILYEIDDRAREILVTRIRHRGDVYRHMAMLSL